MLGIKTHRLLAGTAAAGVLLALTPAVADAAAPLKVTAVDSVPARHTPHPQRYVAAPVLPTTPVSPGVRTDAIQLTTSRL